ncbi:endonuclease/exonuclease/phosphatase family protein [Micromonospora sp. C95]|uniref:endonuclease/exonuclease/phosphatase family protein n=1 Tax=Micromonospora sp. C95 TaxID=2824882 RepID=UPI001B39BC6E|nr:endonuclease/exonuclease/phosphatase family protein [Micromonospora sp. C95]MBQ1024028.1 endonuclease/exonuclease/phosphatase family protein [Micromonospora sp. C95]
MTTATPVAAAGTEPDQLTRTASRGWPAVLLVTAAALWLAFTVTHLAISGHWWLWLAVDAVPPLAFALVPVILGAGAAVLRWRRRTVALLAAAALLLGAGQSGINTRRWQGGDGAAPADAVRVFVWNTDYWDEGGQTEALYRVLREADADVYLLQEYWYARSAGPTEAALERLRAEFPGFHVVVVGELVTVSRLPVLRQAPLAADDLPPAVADAGDQWRYKTLRTDLDVGGSRVLSMYNLHLPVQLSPDHGPFDPDFYRVLREQHAQREPQWRALAADVTANPHPVLLAGDLNTSPAMGDLRKLPDGLRDAGYAMPSLYPASWADSPGWPQWWRLDWAFVSPDVRVHSYRFGAGQGVSDHRPQELVLSLPGR